MYTVTDWIVSKNIERDEAIEFLNMLVSVTVGGLGEDVKIFFDRKEEKWNVNGLLYKHPSAALVAAEDINEGFTPYAPCNE